MKTELCVYPRCSKPTAKRLDRCRAHAEFYVTPHCIDDTGDMVCLYCDQEWPWSEPNCETGTTVDRYLSNYLNYVDSSIASNATPLTWVEWALRFIDYTNQRKAET